MNLLRDDIPMLWPSGPLAVAKRQKSEGFAPETRQVLERWHQPAALDLLKNSPINCIVLPWAAGLAEDRQQWQSSSALIQAARAKNLKVVGWIEEMPDPKPAIAAGQSAGLTAVAAHGSHAGSGIPVIPWAERGHAPWDTKAPVLPVTDNVWPGVQAQQGGAANAGPTGKPWVESNAWFVELAKERTPATPWLMFDPPAGSVVRAQSYVVCVMDTEAFGGRWIISFDDNLRGGLVGGNATAMQSLEGVSQALRFFAQHREWESFRSQAVVGVLSDFAGDNFEMGGEVLKLTARRGLLTRPVWADQALTKGFPGLKALVRYDEAPPPAALRKRILDFVSQGGLLITGPKWGAEGKAFADQTHSRYEMRALGKGKLAVARENVVDPYEASIDIQSIVSRANDLVRLFNTATSGGIFLTGSPDGKRVLLQLVNYTGAGRGVGGGGTPNVVVWLARSYRSARLLSPALEQPQPLNMVKADWGYEYHIPSLPAFAAIEFEV